MLAQDGIKGKVLKKATHLTNSHTTQNDPCLIFSPKRPNTLQAQMWTIAEIV